MKSGKTLEVQDLLLEVTRSCNMSCAHCLRGDAQNAVMSEHVLESVLSRVSSIRTLTFTGGEPSLAPEIILKSLELVKANGINIEQVYIVTNGKSVPDLFLNACIQWHIHTVTQNLTGYGQLHDKQLRSMLRMMKNEERYYGCYVALSADTYHEPIPADNLASLSALPNLFEDKTYGYSSSRHPDEYIIKTGRAL